MRKICVIIRRMAEYRLLRFYIQPWSDLLLNE